MSRGKIQDVSEVRRWYERGEHYNWMVAEYMRRYNIEISPSAFSNLRIREGWEKRYVDGDGEGQGTELIPWVIERKHVATHAHNMLRAERRRRAGHELTPLVETQVETWKRGLKDVNGVIHYDPETDRGFFVVPREDGDDDLIRRPV